MSALARAPQVPPQFEARVLRDVSMAKHTSWHVGGTADLCFVPRDVRELAAFLRQLEPQLPILWVGLGSNLLVRDGGVRGVVIMTHGALGALARVNATTIQAEAGVPCARIARQCVQWGLGSAEFLAGIPGTLGGALAMNAGAWGGETWRHVLEVDTLDRRGLVRTRPAADFEVGYRSVHGPEGEWFVAARLHFEPRPDVDSGVIRDLLERRKQSQPIGEWSCGSVFTNPPGEHAARLIETAGLKGFRIGDAAVSMKHANFIINHGAARAVDIEAVIRHVQETVAARHGILLRTEVRIVGESE
ncbi:MAG: UDP-N-acetylmuramate dehydrogenase [Steroidobacteraceae bacterium]|nr:UDP-N-acetylmuramate dehydrogenase [Steroidobacteraceae bacterium]